MSDPTLPHSSHHAAALGGLSSSTPPEDVAACEADKAACLERAKETSKAHFTYEGMTDDSFLQDTMRMASYACDVVQRHPDCWEEEFHDWADFEGRRAAISDAKFIDFDDTSRHDCSATDVACANADGTIVINEDAQLSEAELVEVLDHEGLHKLYPQLATEQEHLMTCGVLGRGDPKSVHCAEVTIVDK